LNELLSRKQTEINELLATKEDSINTTPHVPDTDTIVKNTRRKPVTKKQSDTTQET
jgi:hypothetical protein